MVMPCLDNLELPYADDSAAVTPTSEELCNFYNTHFVFGANAFGYVLHYKQYPYIHRYFLHASFPCVNGTGSV